MILLGIWNLLSGISWRILTNHLAVHPAVGTVFSTSVPNQKGYVMKRMIGICLLIAGFSIGAEAQTNRTYKTDLSNERLLNDRGAGNVNSQQSLQMNSVQPFYGNSNVDQYLNGNQGNNLNHRQLSSDDLPYRSIPYDTSKNNGHCLGCGSGTLTDPHRR